MQGKTEFSVKQNAQSTDEWDICFVATLCPNANYATGDLHFNALPFFANSGGTSVDILTWFAGTGLAVTKRPGASVFKAEGGSASGQEFCVAVPKGESQTDWRKRSSIRPTLKGQRVVDVIDDANGVPLVSLENGYMLQLHINTV